MVCPEKIYVPLIENTLQKHKLPKELFYLAMVESGFDNKALSQAKLEVPGSLFVQQRGIMA